jgi:hypothetical protein
MMPATTRLVGFARNQRTAASVACGQMMRWTPPIAASQPKMVTRTRQSAAHTL